MQYRFVEIKSITTEKVGMLSFFEANRDIPFEIKRIYYISKVPVGSRRGAHAHKELKQLLFCPYGSITIILNDGSNEEKITLDNPEKGLILMPGLWRDMEWNIDDSVLCVAASDYYSEEDYIRDYEKYIEYLNCRVE